MRPAMWFCVGLLGLTACASAEDDSDAGPVDVDAARFVPDAAATDATVQVVDAAPTTDAGADAGSDVDGGVIAGVCVPGDATVVTNATVTPLADLATTTSTVAVAGADLHIAQVVVRTSLTHTFNGDMDIVLVSPRGTRVLLTSDNAGTNANVFNGTTWTDAGAPVTDFLFADGVVAATLAPESALSAFFGEDPNGTWTLELTDDAAMDTGTLSSWTLEVAGFPATVTYVPSMFTSTTAVPIADVSTTTDTLALAGAPAILCDLNVTTTIAHTFPGDLDIALVAPSGTRVVLTTDNGGSADDVFNGTTWDDSANAPVTEHVFTSGVVAPSLTAEGALGAFAGEDANGVWTLQVTDDGAEDVGTLTSWSLEPVGCACP